MTELLKTTESEDRISTALSIIYEQGLRPSADEKTWVIDQVVRALCGCKEEMAKRSIGCDKKEYVSIGKGINDEYRKFIDKDWNPGIAPDGCELMYEVYE